MKLFIVLAIALFAVQLTDCATRSITTGQVGNGVKQENFQETVPVAINIAPSFMLENASFVQNPTDQFG